MHRKRGLKNVKQLDRYHRKNVKIDCKNLQDSKKKINDCIRLRKLKHCSGFSRRIRRIKVNKGHKGQ